MLGLKFWKSDLSRRPTKIDSFKRIKSLGVPVGSVLDVGVQTCTAELIDAFPGVPHLLMEPISEFAPRIHENYRNGGVSYELLEVAVSNQSGDVNMKTSTVKDAEDITHARMVDIVNPGDPVRQVPMRTLDELLAERDIPKPYLLKIDVDGAELKVLEGAKQSLADCSVICIEAGIKTFLERANVIMAAGFQAFDIVDLCYYDGRLVQTDMVFINDAFIQKSGLEVNKNGLDINKGGPLR